MPGFFISHEDPRRCPTQRWSYCSICADYGHTTDGCTEASIAMLRKPHFIEQLISPNLRETYGICTRTPLPNAAIEIKDTYAPSLEVPKQDKVIRAILMNYGLSYTNSITKNMATLEQYAKTMKPPRVVNFLTIADEETATETPAEAKKPKSKNPKKAKAVANAKT